ncbi:MAG: hypothetical protein WDA16_06265 [Candidatus Thermoplasmatota archaeon]
MTDYETLQATTHRIGRTGFIEVARRRLKEEDAQTDFIMVARGFYAKDGGKKWTRYVTIPDEPDAREWLARQVRDL